MSKVVSKVSTLSRAEIEKVIEDLWNRANVIQRLTYLLETDLEDGLSPNRAIAIEGNTVTLMFQKRGIDITRWLAGESWSKTVDLLEILDDLNSDVEAPARTAVTA